MENREILFHLARMSNQVATVMRMKLAPGVARLAQKQSTKNGNPRPATATQALSGSLDKAPGRAVLLIEMV
jgi:hypothetical protein